MVSDLPKDKVEPHRMVPLVAGRLAIGVCGGVAWNIFASEASRATTNIIRDVIAGAWFLGVWSLIRAVFPKIRALSLARQMIVGAFVPFIAMALSIICLWLLPFIIMEGWWVFVTLGVISASIEWCAGGGRRGMDSHNPKNARADP